MQNYLHRFASLERTSSSYITDKENGADNIQGKILIFSNYNRFYISVGKILLTVFWNTSTIIPNLIIEGNILVSINGLLSTVRGKRGNVRRGLSIIRKIVTIVESALMIERRILSIERRKTSIGRRIMSNESLILMYYNRKESVDIRLLYADIRLFLIDSGIVVNKRRKVLLDSERDEIDILLVLK